MSEVKKAMKQRGYEFLSKEFVFRTDLPVLVKRMYYQSAYDLYYSSHKDRYAIAIDLEDTGAIITMVREDRLKAFFELAIERTEICLSVDMIVLATQYEMCMNCDEWNCPMDRLKFFIGEGWNEGEGECLRVGKIDQGEPIRFA